MSGLKIIQKRIINTLQSMMIVLSMTVLLGAMGWLIGGFFYSLLAVSIVWVAYVFNAIVSPIWVMRLYRGRRIHFNEAPRLYAGLALLSKRAGIKAPDLYYLQSDAMNAFTAGDRNNAAIGISNGLLRRLDLREIMAVLAHEIGHIRGNDMNILRFADISRRLTHVMSIFGQILLIINLPLFLLGQSAISWVTILLLLFAPTISLMMQLALSRIREYRADIGGAELMGSPHDLIAALKKIDQYNRPYPWRFLLYGPYREPVSSLFQTHPPTRERIRRLRSLQRHTELPPIRQTAYASQPVQAWRFRTEEPGFLLPSLNFR
jgi:heat shock protein HtpX